MCPDSIPQDCYSPQCVVVNMYLQEVLPIVVVAASVVLVAEGSGINWYLCLSALQVSDKARSVPGVEPELSSDSQHKPLSMCWMEPVDVNLKRRSLRETSQSPNTTNL